MLRHATVSKVTETSAYLSEIQYRNKEEAISGESS